VLAHGALAQVDLAAGLPGNQGTGLLEVASARSGSGGRTQCPSGAYTLIEGLCGEQPCAAAQCG
jgi:hypothetical protein